MYEFLAELFQAKANPSQAQKMSAYMREQFAFYGIPAPLRKELLKKARSLVGLLSKEELFDFVANCWKADQREMQYAAMAEIDRRRKWLSIEDIPFFIDLVTTKSWWDTVDWIAPTAIGLTLIDQPELLSQYASEWIESDNIWLQRTAIISQLKFKEQVISELLFDLIDRRSTSKEFFIQKAGGWALRQHSKLFPEQVESFLKGREFSRVTMREATKFL